MLALLTASLFGGLAGVTWKWLEANEQRDQANAHARKADDEKHEALYQAYRARLAAAAAALQKHDVADATRQLEAAPRDLRGWEWRHFQSRLDDSSEVIPLPTGGGGFLIAEPEPAPGRGLDRRRPAPHGPGGRRAQDTAARPRTRAFGHRHADPPRTAGRGVGREHGL